MRIIDFIAELQQIGISLRLDGEQLHIEAERGTLTQSLHDQVVARKSEIIEFLRRVEEVSEASQKNVPALTPVSRDADLTLSYAQERLWFLDQLEPESAVYNIPEAIRIRGDLRPDILEESFTRLIERHENLRTVFESRGGRPVQVIKSSEYFRIPMVDLSEESEEKRERHASELARMEADAPFNLSEGPLLRAKLIRMEEGDHVLVVNMHHIISDGWSMVVLIREICEIANALIRGEEPKLPALSIQYADFAVWQRHWLEGGELQRQIEYWKKQLSGIPESLSLTTDYPRPAVQTYNGFQELFTTSKEVMGELDKLSREEGATLFMTLLAAYNVFLYRYSGQGDISVGTPMANRNRKELEGLIGFFVNTIVMRSKISAEQTFAELLNQVRQTAFGAYEHQEVPFEKLVEAINPKRDRSRLPLHQVWLFLQDMPEEENKIEGLDIASFDFESRVAKWDLAAYFERGGEGLRCTLEYNTDLFKRDTIVRMCNRFKKLLQDIAANPKKTIIDLCREELQMPPIMPVNRGG